MKNSIAALLLLLTTTPAWAQITISEQQFLSLSTQTTTTFTSPDTSSDSTLARALANLSGAGMTWDFTTMHYAQGTQSAPNTILPYPSGAALANDPDFTSATNVSTSSVANGGIGYVFYKIDATGLWVLGESEDSLGTQFKIAAYHPPFQEFAFPLAYGTNWQNSFALVFSHQLGVTDTESTAAIVDGYGTLVTPPSQSNSVLRVKTKTIDKYSEIIGGTTYSGIDTTYSFDYYTQSAYSASISTDATLHPYGISYTTPSSSSVATGPVFSQDDPLTLRLSDNPASSIETSLSFTLKNEGSVEAAIMDNLGRTVRMLQNGRVSAGTNIIPIDPKTLAPGTYFIRVQAEGMSAMRKLVISR